MKSFLPLLSLAMVFASCSSTYQSGQTPDDVYYSPERARDEYVRVQKNDDRRYRGQDYRGEDYYSYQDDRYLRMRVRDRYRWSYLDDYYRDPYAYNYNPYYDPYRSYSYYNGYWNPRTYWNCYYNPYAPTVIVTNPKTPVYSKPRTYNLHVFDGPQVSQNPKYQGATRSRDYYTPGEQQRNSNRDAGNSLRRVFGNSESPSYNPPSSNSSSSSSSSSGSSSSGSSSRGSGGNAPVRRF